MTCISHQALRSYRIWVPFCTHSRKTAFRNTWSNINYSDWMILEYEYETHSRTFYDRKARFINDLKRAQTRKQALPLKFGEIEMVVILPFVVVAVSTEYPQKFWNSAGHKLIKMLFYDYLCMIYNLTSICLNFTRITYSNHFPLSPMLKQFTMVTAILDFRSSHIQIHIRCTNL